MMDFNQKDDFDHGFHVRKKWVCREDLGCENWERILELNSI